MSGKRLGSFRSGDRSEYLAAFALSRVAFVDPVPRPEDFGVFDFVCVLAAQEGKNIYPESAFFVQVKSDSGPIDLDTGALRWITQHMDQPLMICVISKSESTLTLYSCARLWWPLGLRPYAGSVRLLLDEAPDVESRCRLLRENADGPDAHFELYLGRPILSQSIAEMESDPGAAHAVLRPWLLLDAQNIARRHMGRISASCFASCEPNTPPASLYENRYFIGPYFQDAERQLAPVLTGLAHCYRHAKNKEKCEAISRLLAQFPEFLDQHGLDFATGKDIVE